jgi:hypothetical protein
MKPGEKSPHTEERNITSSLEIGPPAGSPLKGANRGEYDFLLSKLYLLMAGLSTASAYVFG